MDLVEGNAFISVHSMTIEVLVCTMQYRNFKAIGMESADFYKLWAIHFDTFL